MALTTVVQSTMYTDSISGITFSGFSDQRTGYRFGLALPEVVERDLIGQIVAPLPNGAGWAGVDFGSSMVGHLLIAAWPHEGNIVSSFRIASAHANPAVYNGNMTIVPIGPGTFYNSTHMSYTFLCRGCITGNNFTFSPTATTNIFGWALSNTALPDTSSSSTPLNFHRAGFGTYSLSLVDARSPNYAKWANMVSGTSRPTAVSGGLISPAPAMSMNPAPGTPLSPASASMSPGLKGSMAPAPAMTWGPMPATSMIPRPAIPFSPVPAASANPAPGGSANISSGSSTYYTTTVSSTTYDYIIAGGGTSGIIVAERLAETGASVLLIERGGPSAYWTGGRSVVAWNHTVTQYEVPALDNYLRTFNDTSEYCRDTAAVAGCLLGGSSMINALMFVKPQDKDFDDKWPVTWKSVDVASAASRVYQRNPGTTQPSADGYRYDQGAYVELAPLLTSMGFRSVNALEDINSKIDVFSHPPINVQHGERAGPVMNYLPLATSMSNFRLMLNTNVVRVIRNSSWVSGIEVETSPTTREIINVTPGRGKVILAAGTLSTPRILIYSGIGPVTQIQRVQSVLSRQVTLPSSSSWINLPVGQGVKDHPILSMTFATDSPLSALAPDAFTSPTVIPARQFAQGSGLLTQSNQRLNFWTSVVSPSDGLTRYIQGTCNSPANNTILARVYLTHGLTSYSNLGLDPTGVNTTFDAEPWLRTPGDNEAYALIFDRLLQMARAPNSTLTPLLSNGTVASANMNGAAYLENVRSTLQPGMHWVGTAKMGIDDGRRANGSSVVDTNTKVYGTDNLFVVDASIHPDLPTGNSEAIIMVAAERAAEKILALNGTAIGMRRNLTGYGHDLGGDLESSVPYKNKRWTKRLRHPAFRSLKGRMFDEW